MNVRPRRLRYNQTLRSMLQEVRLQKENLIYPLFVKEGISGRHEVPSMPGVYQLSLEEIIKEALDAYQKGVRSIIIFGIPTHKDAKASGSYDENGIVQQAISRIKEKCPDLFIITDVCLCEYMDHGHCGLLSNSGEVLNDPSLELLARSALSHVKAGADMVAPSDMMDGRVMAIRERLDADGYQHIPIMSYAVKYASHFYGPFRDAAQSAPSHGDRKSYQMDFSNRKEALKEAFLDEAEGADILMVKPALPYLDILKTLEDEFDIPLAAYQVSGEYSMIKAAALNDWIDERGVVIESLTAIKRAGAQLILTYFAKEVASAL